LMTLGCTKKLLNRVPSSPTSSRVRPTNAVGDWYADILFAEPAGKRALPHICTYTDSGPVEPFAEVLGWRWANRSSVWESRTNRIGAEREEMVEIVRLGPRLPRRQSPI
jgi:hypothetical protein